MTAAVPLITPWTSTVLSVPRQVAVDLLGTSGKSVLYPAGVYLVTVEQQPSGALQYLQQESQTMLLVTVGQIGLHYFEVEALSGVTYASTSAVPSGNIGVVWNSSGWVLQVYYNYGSGPLPQVNLNVYKLV